MGNEEQEKIYDEGQISRLLSELKHIEAPNDFEFRVKARIAAGKAGDKAALRLPTWIRYAVPLVVFLLVGGYFAFNSLYSSNIAKVQPITEDQPTEVAPMRDLPSSEVAALPTDPTIDGTDAKLPQIPGKSRLPREKKIAAKTDRPGGGSIDLSLQEGVKINARLPDPNSRLVRIPAKNVLTLIGITATYDASGWNAISVRGDSIAARSGVRAGDVIEAINDQPANEKTAFANRSTLRNLRVRRDGKGVQIDLIPK